MSGAAFFDLDRTLLAGASWPVYNRALRQTGVVADRDNPVLDALFGIFRVFGESFLTMQATRRAIGRTRGWRLDGVDAAARLAVPELLGQLQPFAGHVVDEHRRAGRPVVLATTTPERLVRPLVEALGFDDVVATRYGERHGCFDGTIDGPFVWNRGKLDAVRRWAAERGIRLAECFAYSDSFFDAPLLDAVGHPTAVNPDIRLAALARLRGWPLRWLDKPEGVPKFAGLELQELVRPYLHEALFPFVRFDLDGLEHLAAPGGAVVCANHRSYFDPTVLALAAAQVRRPLRFLGKKEVFDAPIVGGIAAAAGGIRVDRGSGSDEPLLAAAAALGAGELVAIMPQGTIPRGPAFFEPLLAGRPGAARLACQAAVPVVPVGLWGTEAVWPRSSRLPRLELVDPPRVRLRVGAPLTLSGEDADQDTARIMSAIAALLPDDARARRTPSAEELARTYPPGYDPNRPPGAGR
ncbi:MAG: HAD-IB family hydrolase [Acidimicrobiia bacterium]|nr:HAD-IB family hydrolase [Acidimicrobiia bacterium]